VDNTLQLKLTARLAHLETLTGEPVMDDFDCGIRSGRYEELTFLEKVLKEYGEPKERKGNSCSGLLVTAATSN
jgi:hypothetical protein